MNAPLGNRRAPLAQPSGLEPRHYPSLPAIGAHGHAADRAFIGAARPRFNAPRTSGAGAAAPHRGPLLLVLNCGIQLRQCSGPRLRYFLLGAISSARRQCRQKKDRHMPRWMRDKLTWIVVFAAVAAVSSAYSAYKLYQMTDGRPVPTKSRK